MTEDILLDRFAGALLGLAYGDALGMPAEGLRPYEVWAKFQWLDSFFKCPRTGRKAGEYTGVAQLSMMQAMALAEGGRPDLATMEKGMEAVRQADKARWGPASVIDYIPARMVPVGLFYSVKPIPDPQLLQICKSLALKHTSKRAILSSFLVAWCVKELIRNSENLSTMDELYLADNSMMARMIEICAKVENKMDEPGEDLWKRLDYARKKVDAGCRVEEFVGICGNGAPPYELVPFSLFCFLNGPDDAKSMERAANMGGASSLNAGLVGALVGAHTGSGYIKEATQSVEGAARIIELSRRLLEAAKNREG